MKLITWNIQRGRGPRGCSMERAVADLRNWTDFDVLCLQEVASGYTDLPGSDGRDQFSQLPGLLSEYQAVAGVTSDTLDDGGVRRLFGMMIFSRFPVLKVTRHALPWPADPAVPSMQRGALETTLATAQGLIRVTTTHLEYFSLLQRSAQVERLRELHREASAHARGACPPEMASGPFGALPSSRDALLVGDFNFLPGSDERARLLAPFDDDTPAYRDAWQSCYPDLPHAPTVGLHAPSATPFTFDFIFVSAPLAGRVRQVRVAADIVGPDHQPVLIELS
jgi:endonuclease/exonuclease/phosphatase family metal-dependent hydrolase